MITVIGLREMMRMSRRHYQKGKARASGTKGKYKCDLCLDPKMKNHPYDTLKDLRKHQLEEHGGDLTTWA